MLNFIVTNYLPFFSVLQLSKTEDLEEIQKHVLEELRAGHSRSKLNKREYSALKRKIMVDAYKSVPTQLLLEVKERFKYDFDLFDYDPEPEDIFS